MGDEALIEELGLQGFMRKPSASKYGFSLLIIALLIYAVYSGNKKLQTINPAISIESARIVGFVANGKGVIVETVDGKTVTIRAKYRELAGCRRGMPVRLQKRGETYSLSSFLCQAPIQDL